MRTIFISTGVVIVIVAGYLVLRSRTVEPSSSRADEPSVSVSSGPAVSPANTTLTPAPTAAGTTFSTAQVALHNSQGSCYTIIRGAVYDLSAWISKHPGGEAAILKLCGKDGTTAFENQHGGQTRQENILASFKIGVLAP